MSDFKTSEILNEPRKRNGVQPLNNQESEPSNSTASNQNLDTPFTRSNVYFEVIVRFLLAIFLAVSEKTLTPFNRKIQRSEWPLYMNPYKKDTVSVAELFGCMAAIPLVGIISGYFTSKKRLEKKGIQTRKPKNKQFHGRFNLCDPSSFVWCDAVDMLLAFSLAILIVMTFGNYAKYWVGRPRPDYFDRCFNNITKETDPESKAFLSTRNVDINDIQRVSDVLKKFYTVGEGNDVKPFSCFQEDNESRHKILEEGRKSFPSGHSLSAGAVFWFCSLYSLVER